MKKLILAALVGVFFLQSCKKDQANDTQDQDVSQEEAESVIASDKTTDDVLDMIDMYAADDIASRPGADTNKSFAHPQLPACVTQTIVRNGTSATITWEFDANGCLMPNGNTYSGTIVINRTFDMTNHTFSGAVAFDQFYVNDIQVAGGFDYVRVRSNANGHPQSTNNFDFTLSFPNGDVAQRAGTRVREMIQGFDTFRRDDDVFLVTGNSHIQFRNGTVVDAIIVTPLRREIPCRYFVSGTINITKNGRTAVIDFGAGTCDNEATLTLPNGTVRVIHL